MIVGIGIDLVSISRMAEKIKESSFREKVFSKSEREYCESCKDKEQHYAVRFAAKEACSKALGTGLRKGVFWRDMGVVNAPSGRPTLVLTGGAAEQLKSITPAGYEPRIDLTLTDDFPQAQAIVIITGIPADREAS